MSVYIRQLKIYTLIFSPPTYLSSTPITIFLKEFRTICCILK